MALLAAVLISLAALQVTVEESTCPEEPVIVYLSRGQRVTIRYWVGEGALQEVTELPKVSRRPVVSSRPPDDTTPLPSTTLPPTTVPTLHGKLGDESFAATDAETVSTDSTTLEQTTQSDIQTTTAEDVSDSEDLTSTVTDSVTASTLPSNDTTEVLDAREGVSDAQPSITESTTLEQQDTTTSESSSEITSTTSESIIEEKSSSESTELPSDTTHDSTTQSSTTREETSLPDSDSVTTEIPSTPETHDGLLDRSALEVKDLPTEVENSSIQPEISSVSPSEETTVESSTTALPSILSTTENENVYSYVEKTEFVDDSTIISGDEEDSAVKEEANKDFESTAYADSTVASSTNNAVDIVITAEEFSENPLKGNDESVPASEVLDSTSSPAGELTYQYAAGESTSSSSERNVESSPEPSTESASSHSLSTDSSTSSDVPVVSEEITTGSTSTESNSSDNLEVKLLDRSETEQNFPIDDNSNVTDDSLTKVESNNNNTDSEASLSVTEASGSTTTELEDSTTPEPLSPDVRVASQEAVEVTSTTVVSDSSDSENISSVESELSTSASPELTTVISDVESDNQTLSDSALELERSETVPVSSTTVSSDSIIFYDTTNNVINSSAIDPREENETLVDGDDSSLVNIIESTTLADENPSSLSTELQDETTTNSLEEGVKLNSETIIESSESDNKDLEINVELENASSSSVATEITTASIVSEDSETTPTILDNSNSGLVSSIESILHQVLDDNSTSNVEDTSSSVRASRNVSTEDEEVKGRFSSTSRSLVRPLHEVNSEDVESDVEEVGPLNNNAQDLDIVPLYGDNPMPSGLRRGPDKLPNWYLPDYPLLRVDHAPFQPYRHSHRYYRSTRLTREIKKNSTKCEWIFKTDPGVPLLLTFKNFSTPEAERCIEHHIAVERSNGFEARWCGISGENPGHATFARHEIKLRLYSEEGSIRFPTGFVAEVQALDMNLLRKAVAAVRPLHQRSHSG